MSAPRDQIVAAADKGLVGGMRVAIGLGIILSIGAWFLAFFGLPKGRGSIAAAEREAATIEADEAG